VSSTPVPHPALSVRCPTCDAEPGQNCRQPLGRAHILCPLCGAPPGQDCRQQQACHRARELDAQQLAGRKAKRTPANGRVPRSALTGALAPPSWALEPNGPASQSPPWMLGPPPGPTRDVALREDATSKTTYKITRRAFDAIKEYARVAGSRETGGVLMGVAGFSETLLTDAAPPGPRAQATPSSLKTDGEHDVQFIAALEKAVGGSIRELGYWHTHPLGAGRPSRQDLQHAAGMQETLGIAAGFLEVIVTLDREDWRHPRLHGWLVRPGNPDARRWRWWAAERAKIEKARW
jgi:proteasome lid subunit RPN8/RPN11